MAKATSAPTLASVLDRHTQEGELYYPEKDDAVRCYACGHRCLIKEGLRGICKVRFNQGGKLRVPYGYVAALACDPTEKKPFYHLLPGSQTLTFGMLGCDYHCPFCQNWVSSQALRDPAAVSQTYPISAEEIVSSAQQLSAELVGSSYNEPLITSEWAVAVFKLARQRGLRTVFVSNGNGTPEVLEYLQPWIDGYKIDLKAMSQRSYRRLGGVLNHVLDTIRMAAGLGFWVEIVTLVVPGMNDSPEELREAARFISSVSPGIPWHLTAFHSDYKMMDTGSTTARTLLRAAEIAEEEGLKFVYAGNLPGQVGRYENTRCPLCQRTVVERRGFIVVRYDVTSEGTCPGCDARIPGVWWLGERPAAV